MDSVNTQGECVLGITLEYCPNSHIQKPAAMFNTGNTDRNDSFNNAHHLDEYPTRVFSAQISHNIDNFSLHTSLFNHVLIFLSILISLLASTTNSVSPSLMARVCTACQQLKSFARNSISQFISVICSNKPPIKLNIIVDGIGSTK